MMRLAECRRWCRCGDSLKVKTVKIILGDQPSQGIDELCTVLLGGDNAREIERTGPSTKSKECLDVLLRNIITVSCELDGNGHTYVLFGG